MKDRLFWKKLCALVLPIALQQLMLAVVSASDAVMLNLISQDRMSAVSLATQVSFIQSLFLAAMTIGLSILAAQYWGCGDVGTVERCFAYVLRVTLPLSLGFALLAALAPRHLMGLLTNEPALIDGGSEYLRLVAPSYLFTGISQIYLCILKNSGRARTASVISAVCMAGDMLLNLLLIPGLFGLPRMEIAGAAVSTSVSRGIELVWCMAVTAASGGVRLRPQLLLRTDRTLRRRFWHHTTPVLGNELVWGTGFAMASVIMGHLGSDAVAANSIADVVKNLAACLCLGLGSGGGILLGNVLGAGQLELAKRYGRKLCVLSVVVGAVSGAVLLGCSPLILSATQLSDAAAQLLRQMLIVCAVYLLGTSVNVTVISGIFCAGGDSRFGFWCDTVVMWGIKVPLGLLAAFVWKWPVITVYILLCLDEFLKLPAVWHHYKKYNWVRNLTDKEEQ